MKHAKPNAIEILTIIICLLAAAPASAYHPDAGFDGFASVSFSDRNVVHGERSLNVVGVRMPFVANEGQMDERVKFHARTFGGAVFVTRDGKIVYNLPSHEIEEKKWRLPGRLEKRGIRKATGGVALRETPEGGAVKRIVGEGAAAMGGNYIKGRDASRWKSHAPAYETVSLGEVYDGVVMKLRAYGNNVEKLFFVRPGADPGAIRIRVDGTDGLEINNAGGLEMKTAHGTVSFTAPVAYQEVEGKRRNVDVDYVVHGNTYGFAPGKYDGTRELVIDPLLASTFLGGGNADIGRILALDGDGNVYLAGYTYSIDFPTTPGVYGEDLAASADAFVLKMDSELTTLLASTHLGGSGLDECWALALDENGNVYVGGTTSSDDFPTTPGAFTETSFSDGENAFISKLSGDLATLSASTLLKGALDDGVYALAVGTDGSVYATGITESFDFPVTPGAYREQYTFNWDSFVSKLDGGLTTLFASTLIGGINHDIALDLDLDPDGNVYVTGRTSSGDFPVTAGAHSVSLDGMYCDGFISKLDGNLSALLNSTFLGGDDWEGARGAALDPEGNVYVVGETDSTNFPVTSGAYRETIQSLSNIFISKLDGDLSTVLAATYLGGRSTGSLQSIALDQYSNVYVSGSLYPADFPTTPSAYDTVFDGPVDSFVSKLTPDLSTLAASTHLGGEEDDRVISLALDPSGNVYVAGYTTSADFPGAPAAYDPVANGWKDAFVSKLDPELSADPPPPSIEITEPDGIDDVVDFNDTHVYTIEWLDQYEGDGSIRLYYSTTGPCSPHGLIAFDISEDDESDQYTWDVSDLPEGEYYVSAWLLDDGLGKASDCGDGPITIVHSDQPTIRVEAPDGGDTADFVFTIAWTDGDSDNNAAVSLYYDTDDHGEDGRLIAESISEDDETDRYDWDVSDLPEGDYYIYAIIDDGVNPPVVDYSDGPLTIDHLPRLTISGDHGGSVSAPGHGLFSYTAGSVVNLVATPWPGYDFLYWTGDVSTVADVEAAVTTIIMNENHTVTANFQYNDPPAIHIIEPDGVNDDVKTSLAIRWSDSDSDNDASISLYYDTNDAGRDGVLIVDGIGEDDGADEYTWDVSALPEGDYYVYAVIDDGVNLEEVDYSDGPVTVRRRPMLTISAASGGSVTAPGEGVFLYAEGSIVSLTAAPASGYDFAGWTGDVSTVADVDAAHTTISMDGDYAVTAGFSANSGPAIELIEPDGVEDDANAAFIISWSDSDSDNDASISLYYDTNDAGRDGFLIVDDIGEDDGANQYTWDVSALPEGDYYVYAVIDDGVNPEVVDYSDGIVSVSHGAHFSPIWSGNPNHGMTLWVFGATIDGAALAINDQIGVFDGEECVGLGVVYGPVSNQTPLAIITSMDDGSGAGFTAGAEIRFRIWDADARKLITSVAPQYYELSTGDPVAPPGFEEDGDYGLELAGLSTSAQAIPLDAGWNIFSSYIAPDNPDLLEVVRPLIDSDALVKAVDENGARIIRVLGEWVNDIGDLDPREGYRIKLESRTELVVEGAQVTPPLSIPIASGWNIIGYPSPTPREAMDIADPFIDEGILDKVVDEKGNRIINIMGGWTNRIGDMEGGEGYALKTSADATLTIEDVGASIAIAQKVNDGFHGPEAVVSHFTPSWQGNPNASMLLWIGDVKGVSLSAGDEVGVFDGEKCVGAGVVEAPISQGNFLKIWCSKDDGDGDGFTEGSPITLKIWLAGEQREITDIATEYFDIGSGSSTLPPTFEALADFGVYLNASGASSFEIVQPDGVDDSAGGSYTIRWTDDIPGSDADIHLFYDANGAGEDGTTINATAIREDDETDMYEWIVPETLDGEYYIYAVVDDGSGDPMVVYSPGPVTIEMETPAVCTDPFGICGSCPAGSACYSTFHGSVDFASFDENPSTPIFVGPGEYEETFTITDSMMVIIGEGTVILE